MSERELYQGYGLQAVDEKGRVAIPASLRGSVEANNPDDGEGKAIRKLILSLFVVAASAGYVAYAAGIRDRGFDRLIERLLLRPGVALPTPADPAGAPVDDLFTPVLAAPQDG